MIDIVTDKHLNTCVANLLLQETNQAVPGWLQNFAARAPSYGSSKGRRGGGRFGGRDVRKEYGGFGGGGGGYGGGGYGGGESSSLIRVVIVTCGCMFTGQRGEMSAVPDGPGRCAGVLC
jgi:uncharacterized membrane protein